MVSIARGRWERPDRGFTLIELMVVMAIVATLLAIAAPRYFDHLERAREAALKETLVVVRDAIDKFHGDLGRFPESLDELVSRRYLRRLPVDPLTESSETWILKAPPAMPDGNGAGPPRGKEAVYDLRSGAEGQGRDGTAYGDW